MQGEQEKICFEQIKKRAQQKGDVRLLTLWSKAIANQDSNAFPDFMLPDGFIEHFQVTAADETRKGSKHNIAEKEFERDNRGFFEKESKEFLQSSPREGVGIGTYEMQVVAHDMLAPEYSYKSFVNSFKRNFAKHIGHFQSYSGNRQNGVFLIELVGARITIEQSGRFKEFYRLNNDCELLSYIYGYFEQVHYVVFDDSDDYELIETKDIPIMLERVPQNLTFKVGRYLNTRLNLFIDL